MAKRPVPECEFCGGVTNYLNVLSDKRLMCAQCLAEAQRLEREGETFQPHRRARACVRCGVTGNLSAIDLCPKHTFDWRVEQLEFHAQLPHEKAVKAIAIEDANRPWAELWSRAGRQVRPITVENAPIWRDRITKARGDALVHAGKAGYEETARFLAAYNITAARTLQNYTAGLGEVAGYIWPDDYVTATPPNDYIPKPSE